MLALATTAAAFATACASSPDDANSNGGSAAETAGTTVSGGNPGSAGSGPAQSSAGTGGTGAPFGGGGMMTGSAGTGATDAGSGGAGVGSGGTAGQMGGAGAGGGGGGGEMVDVGTTVSVDESGKYSVKFTHPAWTFGGTLGSAAASVTQSSGSDTLGPYSETSFTYVNGVTRQGRIRAYASTPVVVFGEKTAATATNSRSFPRLSTLPQLPYHLTYSDTVFGDYTLSGLTGDSPFIYFDASASAFILSPASHFMVSETRSESGALSAGISRAIANLPAGFEQTTVLVADTGINSAFEKWGSALQRFGGKTQVANDATVELAKLGYWTDNGGAYYYSTAGSADYRSTLTQVRDYLVQLGTPAGYVQLDSWWYRKGSTGDWKGAGTDRGGTYLYEADASLFPAGLPAFQKTLGLPLITHNRWIDTASPYRSQYKMSANVSIDPAFWDKIAAYLKAAGVITYEQDWLNENAVALTTNLTDQDAFLDNMARAMAANGITIQYCMPLPKHYLQSSKYSNVTTSRVSNDKFGRSRWKGFLYGSRLASAVGEWPWSDVFKSTDLDSLRLSVLSAGMFGVADALNAVNKANVLRAVRSDGVIVKPDVPIVPLDSSIIAEARGNAAPTTSAAYTWHPGGKTTYLFAFSDVGSTSVTFRPSELGYTGDIYVYNTNAMSGRLIAASGTYTDTITGTAYYVVAPVGKSGMAFLGDAGKIASTGKKRIATWSDDGTVVSVSALFAGGETATLHGYAPTAPTATAVTGSVGPVSYDSTNKHFSVLVTPAAGSAVVNFKL